jgi:hypothetical protein
MYQQFLYTFAMHSWASFFLIREDQGGVGKAGELVEKAYARFLNRGRWRKQTHSLVPALKGSWIIPDSVFYSPMTLWMKIAVG